MALIAATGDQVAAQGFANAALYISLHSAVPDNTGSNQTTHARVAAGWTVTNGVATATTKDFTGGAANGAVTHAGFWSTASGAGTFYGWFALPTAAPNDVASNAAGAFRLNSVAITFA